MSLVQVKLPPGMSRPGTVYDARNRWYQGNLVRWFGGVLQAWGGWDQMRHSGGALALDEPVRGMHAWRRDSGAPLLAFGTPTKLWIFGTSTLADETPSGLTTGLATAAQTSGAFGTGAFGRGPFGVGDLAEDVLTEANSWQFDNYGEDLVAWAYSDRRIFLYDASAGSSAVLTNAPTDNEGVLVTPEGAVMALGADGNPRAYAFADPDDPTIWATAPDNLAGTGLLRSDGIILTGRGTSRETLIWTDTELHTVRFVGGEFVYGSQLLGRTSLISRRAVATFNDKAVWMGDRNFFVYDGEVKTVPSEVADYVFNDLNRTQASKVHAVPLAGFQEIVFFYCSAASTECDRYVVYSTLDGTMYTGAIGRTAGVDAGIYPYPIMSDAFGNVYRHEIEGARYLEYPRTVSVAETYPETGANTFGILHGDGGFGALRWGQTFETAGVFATSLSFYLSKTGSPTGNATASLYALDSTDLSIAEPTGAALVVSQNFDVATLSASPDYAWTSLAFTTPFYLPPGVYAAVIEYAGGDDSNYVRVRAHSQFISPTHEGRGLFYVPTSWDDSLADLAFRVTGYAATPLNPFVESGPLELGTGEFTMDISQYVPDVKTLGDSELTIYGAYFPVETERTYGPYTAANPTDLRINARQVRLRVDEVSHGWRFGTPRFEVKSGSRR